MEIVIRSDRQHKDTGREIFGTVEGFSFVYSTFSGFDVRGNLTDEQREKMIQEIRQQMEI